MPRFLFGFNLTSAFKDQPVIGAQQTTFSSSLFLWSVRHHTHSYPSMNFASLIVFCFHFLFFVFVFCLFSAFYMEGVIRFTKKGHILKISSTLKRDIIYSCLW